MENNSETVKEDLKVLKLQDKVIENLSISEVIRAYRKLARFVHPDTSGYESTADFQVLGNAYERLLSIVVDKTNAEESEKESEPNMNDNNEKETLSDEEKFVRDNFHHFNFPTDKNGHFVVIVQNELADVWADCFESIYGKPIVNRIEKTGTEVSRLWKIIFKENELTVHFYNKPKSTKIS